MKKSIGVAYYRLETMDYTEEEIELITECINGLGIKACKAIGTDYCAY